MSDYAAFLASKEHRVAPIGRDVSPDDIHPILKPFQRAQVAWAIKRGRAALFNGTGLGKTIMQVEFARLATRGKALILAPIAVGAQTIREARKMLGVEIHDLRTDWTPREGLNVANYHALHKIDPAQFDTVVLDESSILKNFIGAVRAALIEAFAATPYRLCCTATPAPNDTSEIGNHAEFLGIMRQIEMCATWFVHDEQSWRLKGHAAESFYRWVSTWAMFVQTPSDLGFSDEGYILPPLSIEPLVVPMNIATPGSLFFTGLGGVKDRTAIRKATTDRRVAATIEAANATDEQVLVICGLNDESKQATKGIRGAVEVTGGMTDEAKEAAILGFIDGTHRVLVGKGSMIGFGLNLQFCRELLFLGLSDSYETYYQVIRRLWRFGQERDVRVRIVVADVELEIVANVRRKEDEARELASKIVASVRDYEREELRMSERQRDAFREDVAEGDGWTIHKGDCVQTMREKIAAESVDFSVFSPPFSSLFTYSNSPHDIGNCKDDGEFFAHFRFCVDELLRITKPGRLAAVHIANIPAMLSRDGFIGVKDLRGDLIRLFQACGWIFHGEVTIDKDPQAQAIRTKSKSLLFVSKERDSTWLRPAIADYIIVFRKPGENAVPVRNDDVTREDWIEWARPIWYGIRENDTLQVREAREEKDERHLCALQLPVIERCIRLWSNVGDVVFTPFAGIGSEVYQAIKSGRRGLGVELKESYWRCAVANVRKAEAALKSGTLFDLPTNVDEDAA